jgi:hypothetical protein
MLFLQTLLPSYSHAFLIVQFVVTTRAANRHMLVAESVPEEGFFGDDGAGKWDTVGTG